MTDTAKTEADATGATDAGTTDQSSTASTDSATPGTEQAKAAAVADTQAAADAGKAADDAKAAAEAAAAATKQEPTYDLTLPAESTLDPAVVERTVAYAKAQGLSNDQAKAALDLVHQEASAAVKATLEAYQPGGAEHAKIVEGWEKDTLADATLGKSEAERREAILAGKQVLAKYRETAPEQAEGLVAFLETSGYGNQKDVARFFGWLGKAMGETPMPAGMVTTGTGDARSFFPNSPDLNP